MQSQQVFKGFCGYRGAPHGPLHCLQRGNTEASVQGVAQKLTRRRAATPDREQFRAGLPITLILRTMT